MRYPCINSVVKEEGEGKIKEEGAPVFTRTRSVFVRLLAIASSLPIDSSSVGSFRFVDMIERAIIFKKMTKSDVLMFFILESVLFD
jgi:hypothetical protein